MSARFAGRHVLVTGAARGIGYGIARAFAREEGQVTILDRDAPALASARAALADEGLSVVAALVDVTDRARVFEAVAAAEGRAPLDVLVNNAGIASETDFLSMEPSEWARVLDVNLTGMFHVSQAVARAMAARGRGSIVNMASKNGLAGEGGYAHYNASKGGVVMLTKTMALELAPLGVRVNAVAPGYIETPMSREIDSRESVREFVDRFIPLGRAGTADDVAPIFLFLASDDAAFVTGEVIVADGGQLAGQKLTAAVRARLGGVT